MTDGQLQPTGRARCALCESEQIDNLPNPTIWGTPNLLCSKHRREWGKAEGWPEWLKFVANDEQRRRRRTNRAYNLATDMNESDLGAEGSEAGTAIIDEWESAATDGGLGRAMGQEDAAELFAAAKLTASEIAAVVLRGVMEWSWDAMQSTGLWTTNYFAKKDYDAAVAKIKRAAQEDKRMDDTFTVRCQVSLTWSGIDAADRQKAAEIVAEMMKRFFASDARPPGWAPGVVLDTRQTIVAVTEVTGGGPPARPHFAIHGPPVEQPGGYKAGIQLDVGNAPEKAHNEMLTVYA